MLCLLTPVALIDGHSQTRDLRYIIPGECHIVLVIHLQSAHHIIFRKTVDVLHAHIIIRFQQGESVPAQLVLTDPTLLRIDRQRHNAIKPMAHPDLVPDPVQPPVVKVTLDRPAAPPLLLDDPPLVPVRVLLLRLSQREPTLPHEAHKVLLLPVAVRDKLQQPFQRHPPTEPVGRHRVLPAQFGAGADHPEPLQNALHLRLLDGRGVPVPYLPGKGILQFLQAFLVMWVHRDRLFQDIIQVKSSPAVYNKGCLGKNILVHLVQRVPELGHTHPIQIKDQGIEIPGVLTAPPPPKVRQRGHDSKVRIKNLRQLRQLVGDGIMLCLSSILNLQSNPCGLRHRYRNPVTLLVLIMAFPLKAAHREDLPVKLKGRDRFQKLLQMLIFFTIQCPHLLQIIPFFPHSTPSRFLFNRLFS